MDWMMWAALAGAGAVLIGVALWMAPARTTIVIDTAASTARADLKLLWGLGPSLTSRALPKASVGNPLALFNDARRIGYALMTPGIADATYVALRRLFALKPKVGRFDLALNLLDSAQNLVVQTAGQAALASAPAAIRENVGLSKCDAPGAEVTAKFEVSASPMQLAAIYGQFRNSRPAREFRRRLKRKPKTEKKPPREVRTS